MRPPAAPRRVAPVDAPGPSGPLTPGARPPVVPPVRPPVSPQTAAPGGAAPPPAAPRAASGPALPGTRDPGLVPARGWQPVRPAVVSQAAARFAERAAARRHVARRRWLGAGLATGLGAAVGWLLLLSPVLALDVEEVALAGQGSVVDSGAVAAVVSPHAGTPLPRLDTVALRRELLDVPGVRAAQVERDWPHGLRITLVAREPAAAVPLDGGGVALLDVDGVQVGRADAAPAGLPVVSVPTDGGGSRALAAVLTVLRLLPPELAAEVASASAQTRDAVVLVLRDGATVEWGSAEESALKARVLQTLRSAEASRAATVFDVSAPTLPITRS